ncbi:MAG: PaaI family thioesterase [bacterium]
MSDLLALANQVMAAQPFSVLVGAEITQFGQGKAELSIELCEKHRQQHGFVHGGVLSYAADNALTFAAGSALGPAVVTAEFKINYLRPALGEKLIARASVIHAGKTQAVCCCEVFCVKQNTDYLCAIAQGTVNVLSNPNSSQ